VGLLFSTAICLPYLQHKRTTNSTNMTAEDDKHFQIEHVEGLSPTPLNVPHAETLLVVSIENSLAGATAC
jgi:hypothetical protein